VRDTIRRRAIREDEDKAVEEACAKYRPPTNLDPQPFTRDELRRAERALERWYIFPDAPGPDMRAAPLDERWNRHTVDITGRAPVCVEDEMLAVERGVRWAKVAWIVAGVLVSGYVVWRVFGA
jgi:hypothetical protein